MQDAVAEILLERRALAARRTPFLILSLVLHLLIGLAAILITWRQQNVPQVSVLNIRLAPSPAPPVTVAPPPPAPVTRPVAKPAEKKIEKPAETKPTKKKPVEKTLFGKSPEKPVPAPPSTSTQPATRNAQPETTAGTISAGSAGVTGLEGGNFPYTIYIDRMLLLIGNHWFRPQVTGDLTTRVYFVIERDGRVRDVKIEEESGSASFDRAAKRAVREAAPLPPLPFGYSGTYLGVHLTFH